ncbi:Predicted N-acetyltransferase YhbS [Paenibacillus algorifonticola]|uniref:Predicted N-acetyltransferase YhbS n=1 Tax=Paenibacillus algorifonticola TaxID=684063 RepID=A0A1I1YPS8_9BACL|nr:GNAT family N-acetyltransferase [Paenibacillus algorifonticola]SFE19970.1 Predicted N-acetyltransferase YhbS [Paenibacillus algorifonticola]
MFIRPYEHQDVEAVVQLMADLGYPTNIEALSARMEKIASVESCFTFVAVRDGQAVGLIGCRDIFYYEEDGMVVQISLLVTKQSEQGSGIGTALVAYIEQWARERGASALYLTSGIKESRKKAHAFYEARGFDITGYRFVKKLTVQE